jgi:methionyl-tRNA formyltransferase
LPSSCTSSKFSQPRPGDWATDGRKSLGVTTGRGWLNLLEVQLEGKKRMSVAEFLRGTKLDLTAAG